MSQCNDCLGSVQLQQGPAGPAGAASTVAGPQGPQGLPGADSTVAGPLGPTGPAGTTLIDTITTAVGSTKASYTPSTPTLTFTAPADTLDSDEDILVFEGLVMSSAKGGYTVGMQVIIGGTVVEIGYASGLFGFPNFETLNALCALEFKIQAVRVSSTSIRIESDLKHIPLNEVYSNYSTEQVISNHLSDANFSMKRSSQTIAVSNLAANTLDFKLDLITNDPLFPIKVLTSKLYLLNK